jgi:FkbM family methyltransferase
MNRLRKLAIYWDRIGVIAGTGWYVIQGVNRRVAIRRTRIRPKGLEHAIELRMGNSSDGHVFEQIFVHGEYAFTRELRDVRTVIDLGANIGLASALFLSLWPKAKVVAVEPDPDNYALMQKNLAPFGERARCVKGAVWPTSGSVALDKSAGDRKEWAVAVQEGSGVRAYDMHELVAMAGKPVDLLKVDIEGSEKPLFSGDTSWLAVVRNLSIELHGKECREAFARGMSGWRWQESRCGEYLVCKALERS